jgi:asparagine synthase (glutamine-hydrolysing)
MCGIAGLATRDGLRPDDEALVERMLRVIGHRGPDDQNQISDGQAAIGYRRLAIIDLVGGRQPMSGEDPHVHVTQNGEIYDYLETCADLEAKGHRFTTRSDTEVIAHLFEDDPTGFPQRLRGMFAIAVWDSKARRLVLTRDRLGKKPLYWRLADGRLTYGSELKCILEDPSVERTVDREALALFLQYGYVPAPRTILRGVHKLSPASTLIWEGGEPRIERYWTPTYEPKQALAAGDDTDAALQLLRESVRLRLRSDVPVGVFLSGGMDSSVVTALMAESSPQPVRTYSIGFEERAFDELRYARKVAQLFGTQHQEDVVRLDAIGLLPELADHYDEPFADSSAIATFRVAQIAARDLKVVLTGDGGDEAFGGYERYRLHGVLRMISRLGGPAHLPAVDMARALLRFAPQTNKIRRRADTYRRYAVLRPEERYLGLMSIIPPAIRADLLGTSTLADQDAYLGGVLATGPHDELDRILRTDTLTYLPEDLLVKMDRATMANSLEARAPLLDHRLVEFVARLPSRRKIARGKTKVVLREIAHRLMPRELVERPKMGFGVPVGSWFKDDLGDRFRDWALQPDSMLRDHLDAEPAGLLFAEHRAGRADHGARLWALLMFELWARRWLRPADGMDPETPVAGRVI